LLGWLRAKRVRCGVAVWAAKAKATRQRIALTRS